MKKIIKGRKYDTETAISVGEWDNGHFPSDLSYECETLYRKRNGEYFVHGEGGAASRYALAYGESQWGGGERIMPLSYDAARAWAEEHLDANTYEVEFGKVSEDVESDVMLSIRVDAGAKALLDRMSAQTGRSKGELLAEAIRALANE